MPRSDPLLWALDYYNAGYQALQAKDLQVAEEKLARAYGYAPDSAEVNFALGNLRLEQNRSVEANSFYKAAVAADPKHKGALNNLGVIALDDQQPELARKYLRVAVAIDPTEAKSHYLLARACFEMNDLTDALAEITIALQLKPDQEEFVILSKSIHEKIGTP